ncbi:MAG TPA: hypothetical protein VFJ93_03115 [Gaiellaceae bacterium]|nr:hypothetical protein [Gaiellaceae bacterium]
MAAIVAFEKIIPAKEANRPRDRASHAYGGGMKALVLLFSSLFAGSGSRPRP